MTEADLLIERKYSRLKRNKMKEKTEFGQQNSKRDLFEEKEKYSIMIKREPNVNQFSKCR